MTAKQSAVKKYVVKLSAEERERLGTLMQTGKRPARQLLKARILLRLTRPMPAMPGATARLLRLWRPESTPWRGRASNLWRKGRSRR